MNNQTKRSPWLRCTKLLTPCPHEQAIIGLVQRRRGTASQSKWLSLSHGIVKRGEAEGPPLSMQCSLQVKSTLHSTMRVRIGWAGRSYMIAAGHAWGTKVLSSLCRMITCHRRIRLVFVSSFSSFGFTPPPFITALDKEFLASNKCYMASFLLFYRSISMRSKLDSRCRHPKTNASPHSMH